MKPVTDDDVLAAHQAFFTRTPAIAHIPVAPPTDDEHGREYLAALRRVLENDRKRVTAQETR